MKKISWLFIICLLSSTLSGQNQKWLTWYEISGFTETPKYEQTIEYCNQLAKASPLIKITSFGKSPQGRDLPLLIIDKNRNFTPESVRNSGNAVILIEACIHAGESEGKDAGLMLIRDIVLLNKYPELLDHVTILFIPIFNADGHERFSAYNRINQNGPREMGWRTTAQNLNLNRDFIKADAPEMQQWLVLFNSWLPDFFIDVHTTDGADYQYTITYGMNIYGNMNQQQTEWQNKYLVDIEEKLKTDNILIFPYVSFRQWHNPRSGLIHGIGSPRYSTGYSAAQNRPSLLIETHMLKDYKKRVDATYHMLKHSLKFINSDYSQLIKINKEADSIVSSKDFRKNELALNYRTSTDSSIVKFKGIDYKIVNSDLTGGQWFVYGKQPKEFDIVSFEKQEPIDLVKLPEAYIIPVEWTEIINRLSLHGITYTTLNEPTEILVETTRFSDVSLANNSFEGRQMVRDFTIQNAFETKIFPAGSVIVPMNQRTALVIAHLLEPVGPDSYLRWGFFNSIFERKEYVETYVMEKMAREMIEKNPKLKTEFDKAVAENPQFYNNQYSKLFWFFERTPYWDQQLNLYPICKIYDLNQINGL
ncbi:MAG: M14 family metallopeptidase [Bacteroidales bacterium]